MSKGATSGKIANEAKFREDAQHFRGRIETDAERYAISKGHDPVGFILLVAELLHADWERLSDSVPTLRGATPQTPEEQRPALEVAIRPRGSQRMQAPKKVSKVAPGQITHQKRWWDTLSKAKQKEIIAKRKRGLAKVIKARKAAKESTSTEAS